MDYTVVENMHEKLKKILQYPKLSSKEATALEGP